MVEASMFLGIGFLVASLLLIPLLPQIHNRAVRLTTRRLDHDPLSMAEIRAERDHLRAEHAVAFHRLETRLHNLHAASTAQRADIFRKNQLIETLKDTITARDARILMLEEQADGLRKQARAYEQRLAGKDEQIAEQNGALATKANELARLHVELNDRRLDIESRRVEIATLAVQIDALRSQVFDAHRSAVSATGLASAKSSLIEELKAEIEHLRAGAAPGTDPRHISERETAPLAPNVNGESYEGQLGLARGRPRNFAARFSMKARTPSA